MFVDPMCAFSIRAMQPLRPYVEAGRIQLAAIPLSVPDYEDQGRSTPAAEVMVSLPANQMVAAWTGQELTGTPVASAASVLQAKMAGAAAIHLRGTPSFVWRKSDGSVGRADGLPEEERQMIAARTMAALAAAKARGVALGGWKGGQKLNGKLGAVANQDKADAFAAKLAPIVKELQGRGLSLRQMAAELTAQGIQTARGGHWTAAAVRAVLSRTN